MAATLRSKSNATFQCAFPVVRCPKYRRRVLGGRIETRLKEAVGEAVTEKAAWLVETEAMADHVHPLVEMAPQFGVHRLAGWSRPSRGAPPVCCARRSAHLKSRLPALRPNSYFAATAGGAPPEQINAYAENQQNR